MIFNLCFRECFPQTNDISLLKYLHRPWQVPRGGLSGRLKLVRDHVAHSVFASQITVKRSDRTRSIQRRYDTTNSPSSCRFRQLPEDKKRKKRRPDSRPNPGCNDMECCGERYCPASPLLIRREQKECVCNHAQNSARTRTLSYRIRIPAWSYAGQSYQRRRSNDTDNPFAILT